MNTLALGASAVLLALLVPAPLAHAQNPSLAEVLARSVTFFAPFDGDTQATIAAGDPRLHTLLGQNQTPSTQPGLHTAGMTSLARGQGLAGDALRFTRREAKWLFYRADKNLFYTNRHWSGSVSLWLRVDPQKELAPGYCDPIQITTRQWNDAAFFVDFSKDGHPRDFRLGAFADLSVWNRAKKRVDDIPEDQRPLLKAMQPTPFSSERWTHVAFTWDRFNTGAKDAVATLFLDGQSQGDLQGWEQTFTWQEDEESRLWIGLNYIGLMDELSCFNRALSPAEIRFLAETKSGLAGLLASHPKPPPPKTVVLTFDDSVKSHATVVAPLLKELGFSATFFITEGFDFKTNKTDYMTWDEIRQLHDAGFEIGNHTRDHMAVTQNSLGRLPEQIQHINDQCRRYGIPAPVSFAYPGNAFHLDALPLLQQAGFKFARRGGSPEYAYEEGGGVAYEPGLDHPLLIPSVGDARPDWTLENFRTALDRAQAGGIAVLQFHGVPDRQHPWVHTPPERFRQYMQFLKDNHYTVLAMRDLEPYVDRAHPPDSPMARIEERIRQIKAAKDRSKADFAPPPQAQPAATLRLANATLEAHLRDNADSPKILSGLDSLFHRLDAPGFDAYDPDAQGSSAGLNFEHIISGHKSPSNRFTPRHGPFPLYPLAGDSAAILIRQARDCPWQIDASFQYTLADSNAVDFAFTCAPRQAQLFGARGYGVFFFANYMNDVADPALHFRGQEGPGAEESWIRADAPAGHPDYNGGGTYRSVPAQPLDYDQDHDFKLNLWSYDWPRFTQPFYYGRAAHGMVLILMFDRMHSDADEIRFSLFKFKLPKRPRPAWDFQYVVHRLENNQNYGFKGRLIWKKFVSPENCLEEYTKWRD